MLTPKLPAIALSYGLESLLSNQAELTAQAVAEAACQIYPQALVLEHLQDLCDRLVQRVASLAERQSASGEEVIPPRKSLGYQLQEWSKTLDSEAVCLLLADYDPEKAHHLYWYVESDLVERALKEKLSYLAVRQSGAFEATMYGFGGSYAGDGPSSGSDAVDAFSPEGRQGLAEIGL